MADIHLPDHPAVIDLGNGISLHTGGLTGVVHVDLVERSRALSGDAIVSALAAAGLRPGPVISLPQPKPTPAARELAVSGDGEASGVTFELEVVDDESCVLLVEDAAGGLSWIIPEQPPGGEEHGARALKTPLTFTVPIATIAPGKGTRGFLAEAGDKVQAFFFGITDPLLGPIIHGFAKKWETRHRPSFTRRFGPDDYRTDDPAFARLTSDEWRALAQGPALLFVHGTFSTSAAFRALAPAFVGELSRRYGGRMFAFNHPTMTADPRENALAFFSDIPEDVSLEVDIVCHSRGGLVARQIAALGETTGKLRVRSIVFVGATNAGTALADADHMIDMVSRFTTLAKFIPEGTAKTVVDALVLAVKVLGHGLLHDLEGLAAMSPRGDFMKTMNMQGPSSAAFFAIASDFEPRPGTPLFSLRRAADVTADRVFGSDANDLVVPRNGVFAQNGAGGFPIGEARRLQFGPADGVTHTEFFAEQRTSAQLLEWLAPSAGVGREVVAATPTVDIARVFDAVRDRVLLELAPSGGRRGTVSREPDFTPAELETLRPHVVNLSEGVFKTSGLFHSTPQDVDAIVREHVPEWTAGLHDGEPLRIAVWAHGGLIGERAGLRIAQKHIDWWRRNGVYPIYFAWETGLFDALRSILEGVRRKLPGLGTRDLFDYTSDPIVEAGARALGGTHIWGAMKHNAELASGANGGARYVAERLSELAGRPDLRHGRELELHAVGHSAGAIFQSWFLPVTRAAQVPPFKTLQLLAPAITVAEFDARLAPEIGTTGVAQKAVLYTMKRSYEEDDNCAGIYRKSLLYLIHHALEPEKRTPILGLELSLRADAAAASLFGLNGAPNAAGRVVWSVTKADGRSSSASESHGGFDDDALTMNSVAANVLNEPNARVAYAGPSRALGRGTDGWPVSDDWLAGIDITGGFGGSVTQVPSLAPMPEPLGSPGPAAIPSPVAASSLALASKAGGAKRALCIGIDSYPAPNALEGCVNDTEQWRKTLAALGFEVKLVPERQATRQGILAALAELLQASSTGDVLVFQYSGHGTQVPDYDGDEDDGSDEAMVPIDFESGAFLVDDDLRAIFSQLSGGVNLTCFIDCCHSGSITRMLGRSADENALPEHTHSRYLKRTGDWQDWMRAHERFRQRDRALRGSIGGSSRTIDSNSMRWVNFSACDATEVAYEKNGSGDFTRLATGLLTAQALQRSNRDFQDAVILAFGEGRRQTPQLDCADAARASAFMQPLR